LFVLLLVMSLYLCVYSYERLHQFSSVQRPLSDPQRTKCRRRHWYTYTARRHFSRRKCSLHTELLGPFPSRALLWSEPWCDGWCLKSVWLNGNLGTVPGNRCWMFSIVHVRHFGGKFWRKHGTASCAAPLLLWGKVRPIHATCICTLLSGQYSFPCVFSVFLCFMFVSAFMSLILSVLRALLPELKRMYEWMNSVESVFHKFWVDKIPESSSTEDINFRSFWFLIQSQSELKLKFVNIVYLNPDK